MLEALEKKIIIWESEDLKLETNSMLRRVFNFFFIPILNILPVDSRSLITRSNDSVKDIVNNVTTHKALEVLYNHGYKKNIRKLYQKIAHSVWFGTNNSKAVRNRLTIVKSELKRLIETQSKTKNEIKIVSIAAGSARAIIEALEESYPDAKVDVYFVDKSEDALKYSAAMLKKSKIAQNELYSFNWINDTVNGFLDKNTIKYTLVEMVGLMDYFNDEKALKIFQKIYNTLEGDGSFITANINDNKERPFITKAIGWPMVYRTAEQLGLLVHQAGFPHEKMLLYYEPHKIHSIIIASR